MLPALAFAAALTLVCTTAASARPLDVKPVVFSDPVGDAGAAPDISSVSVGNDSRGGISVDVGFATSLTADTTVDLYLDTDLNPATGDVKDGGAEFVIDDTQSDRTYGLYKWDGTTWQFVSSVGTKVSSGADGKDMTFSSSASDLGQVKGFNFWVEDFTGDGSSATNWDDAPSGTSLWQYTLQTQISLTLYKSISEPVKAGKPWVIALAAIRSDTGELLGSEGTITCRAISGATKLALIEHEFVSAGANKSSGAACAFMVPKTLKGKLLHGTLTVSYAGATVTHAFTQKAG